MKKIIMILLVTVSLVGCTSSGNMAIKNKEFVDSFMVEGASKDNVTSHLGDPNAVEFRGEEEIWIYTSFEAKNSPMRYVPVLGVFLGKTTVETHNLNILFDKNGEVIRYTRGESFNENTLF